MRVNNNIVYVHIYAKRKSNGGIKKNKKTKKKTEKNRLLEISSPALSPLWCALL